jgi:uncharacterized phiE125 gp8 family phage protein
VSVELVTVSGPLTEPVTLAEAKSHLRVEHTDEDTFIESLITAARIVVEGRTGMKLVTQTVEVRADSFQEKAFLTSRGGLSRPAYNEVISLRCAPVQSLESIKYYNDVDVDTTMPSSSYWEDLSSTPARVQVKDSWPSTNERIGNVRVRLTVGFTDAALIPEHFKRVMLLLIGHWNENRELSISGTIITEIPERINDILMSGGAENQHYVI